MPYRLFSSIPGFYPLGASSNPPASKLRQTRISPEIAKHPPRGGRRVESPLVNNNRVRQIEGAVAFESGLEECVGFERMR